MKIGTIVLLILVGAIFVFWKYSGHIKSALKSSSDTTTTGSSATETNGKVARLLWTGLLVIASLAVFFWGIYSPSWKSPDFATVGRWSWEHWLQLLILYGIGVALLKLNKKALGSAEPFLQWVLAALMIGAFFVCGPLYWYEDRDAKQQKERQEAVQSAEKSVPTTVLEMKPGGKSEYIPVPYPKAVILYGNDYRHFCVYADGHEESFVSGERPCSDGQMLYVYALNLREDTANAVTYAYTK